MHRRQFLKLAQGLLVLLACPEDFLLGENLPSLESKLYRAYSEIKSKFSLNPIEQTLILDGQNQKMYAVDNLEKFRINKIYSVSTGKTGFGSEFGSGKTPLGIHRIKEKHGDNALIGTVFKSKKNTNRISEIHTEKYGTTLDLITTRILCLDGCEEKNKNSYSRGIYIHGTPEEGLIGIPVSHGCVRMKNKEVVELYNFMKIGDYLNIKERLI